jgi:hypothetical protein
MIKRNPETISKNIKHISRFYVKPWSNASKQRDGHNSLEEKCLILYSMLKENPDLVQQKIISFVNYHKKE